MQKARLGRTGVEVSTIGLGTWAYGGSRSVKGHAVGWSGHDDGAAREAVVAAFESGIDHFDTADVYGDGQAEALLGTVWDRIPRDTVFLASKVGWDPAGQPHFFHPETIRTRLERSLRLLDTDRIDLFYLHHCDFGPEDRHLEPALATLQKLRDQGKFRFLGLSDWSSAKVRRLADRVDPDVVQIFRTVVDDGYRTSGLADWVHRRDRGAVFFSPLKHGVLLGKYLEPMSFPAGDIRNNLPELQDGATLRRLAGCRAAVERRFPDHPQPVLQALTGALLADAPSASVLVGQRNPEQAHAAGSLGRPLDEDEAKWVRSLYSEALGSSSAAADP